MKFQLWNQNIIKVAKQQNIIVKTKTHHTQTQTNTKTHQPQTKDIDKDQDAPQTDTNKYQDPPTTNKRNRQRNAKIQES